MRHIIKCSLIKKPGERWNKTGKLLTGAEVELGHTPFSVPVSEGVWAKCPHTEPDSVVLQDPLPGEAPRTQGGWAEKGRGKWGRDLSWPSVFTSLSVQTWGPLTFCDPLPTSCSGCRVCVGGCVCHEEGPVCHRTSRESPRGQLWAMGNRYICPTARTWGAAIRLCHRVPWQLQLQKAHLKPTHEIKKENQVRKAYIS